MSSKDNGVEAPGAETQEVEIPSPQVIVKWIRRDIGACISLLSAIHNDSNLQNLVAEWLHGRYVNQENAKAQKPDPRQTDIFGSSPKGAA